MYFLWGISLYSPIKQRSVAGLDVSNASYFPGCSQIVIVKKKIGRRNGIKTLPLCRKIVVSEMDLFKLCIIAQMLLSVLSWMDVPDVLSEATEDILAERQLGVNDAPSANVVNGYVTYKFYMESTCDTLISVTQYNFGMCSNKDDTGGFALHKVESQTSSALSVGMWRYTDNVCTSALISNGVNNYTTYSIPIGSCTLRNDGNYMMASYSVSSTSDTNWQPGASRDTDGVDVDDYVGSTSALCGLGPYMRSTLFIGTNLCTRISSGSLNSYQTESCGNGNWNGNYYTSTDCSAGGTAFTNALQDCVQSNFNSNKYITRACFIPSASSNSNDAATNTLQEVGMICGIVIGLSMIGCAAYYCYTRNSKGNSDSVEMMRESEISSSSISNPTRSDSISIEVHPKRQSQFDAVNPMMSLAIGGIDGEDGEVANLGGDDVRASELELGKAPLPPGMSPPGIPTQYQAPRRGPPGISPPGPRGAPPGPRGPPPAARTAPPPATKIVAPTATKTTAAASESFGGKAQRRATRVEKFGMYKTMMKLGIPFQGKPSYPLRSYLFSSFC